MVFIPYSVQSSTRNATAENTYAAHLALACTRRKAQVCTMKTLTPSEIETIAADRGIPMAELLRRAGIHRTTFSRWLAGDTEPTLSVYRRIIAALEQDVV